MAVRQDLVRFKNRDSDGKTIPTKMQAQKERAWEELLTHS